VWVLIVCLAFAYNFFLAPFAIGFTYIPSDGVLAIDVLSLLIYALDIPF
jgi:hypothetical protein